jgi:hypothetical protein
MWLKIFWRRNGKKKAVCSKTLPNNAEIKREFDNFFEAPSEIRANVDYFDFSFV